MDRTKRRVHDPQIHRGRCPALVSIRSVDQPSGGLPWTWGSATVPHKEHAGAAPSLVGLLVTCSTLLTVPI